LKQTLTGGLLGTVSAVPPVLAGAPWWAVLLVVLVGHLAFLTSLHMTYREAERLAKLGYTGSFKGPWGVEHSVSSGRASPETEPLKLRRRVRRKPPPGS
jgi:hypothetical protein